MAALTRVEVLVPDAQDGPFRYGFRYVQSVDEQGAETWEQVPLTLADVLHPQEGDFVNQSNANARRCIYLYDIFQARLASDPTAVVLHDTLIAWDVPGLKPLAPDVVVMLGVRARKDWGTFNVRDEEAQTVLLVEVTSPATAVLDRSNKLDLYELAGVPLYIVVDAVAHGQAASPRLLGYRLVAGRYQALVPDERGRLWLEPVRTWLGVEAGEIVCFDEAGQPLGDYRTVATALTAAEQRLRVLEDEVRRLRGH
jgi:hypothetical protein